MITIIAGSRNVTEEQFRTAITSLPWKVTRVVSGTARGVDTFGEGWAKHQGLPVDRYPADWDTHGKSAGYKRNILMAENAEALFAIWDGESRGTKHMIDIATAKGLVVRVVNLKEDT